MALAYINLSPLALSAGPSAPPPSGGTRLQTSHLTVPAGYQVQIVVNTLNFATAVAVGPDNAVYVTEAGFSYGNMQAPPRVLRIDATTEVSTTIAQQGLVGPVAGLAVSGNTLFISHRDATQQGVISRVDLARASPTITPTAIITGLPSVGDYYNENLAVGPDNKLSIFLASAKDPDPLANGRPILRPTHATFSPHGQTLFVTHFGEFFTVPGGVAPRLGTGALIRITSSKQQPPGAAGRPTARRPNPVGAAIGQPG